MKTYDKAYEVRKTVETVLKIYFTHTDLYIYWQVVLTKGLYISSA